MGILIDSIAVMLSWVLVAFVCMIVYTHWQKRRNRGQDHDAHGDNSERTPRG